jgi:assimilatory nitrate reductase catalytic subunit
MAGNAGRKPLGTERLFADNRFFTPDGKARLIALSYRAPVNALSADYPLVLNTGRIRDQWHTMTRSGLTPRLLQHIGEPFAEMHPDEAKKLGVTEGGLVRLSSRWGKAVARVQISAGPEARLALYAHALDRCAQPQRPCRRGGESGGGPGVRPARKQAHPGAGEAYPASWHGYLLSREPLALPAVDYAVAIRLDNGWRYELASDRAPDDWSGRATAWLRHPEGEMLEYQGCYPRHPPLCLDR